MQEGNFSRMVFAGIGVIGLVAVGFGFVVPGSNHSSQETNEAASDTDEDTVEERIRPVGQVRIQKTPPAETVAAQAPEPEPLSESNLDVTPPDLASENAPSDGEAVARASCFACHQTGVLDAPKMGDTAEWERRLGQGFEPLLAHAIQGFNAMPAKGGNPQLSDAAVRNALVYMLDNSGVSLPESMQQATEPTVVDATVAPDTSAPTSAVKATGVVSEDDTSPVSEAPSIEATQLPASTAATPSPEVTPATIVPRPVEPEQVMVAYSGELYADACASCHDSGTDGAPRIGDQSAWTGRLAKGMSTLVQTVVQGDSAHPNAIGGATFDDADVGQAINFMMQETFWPVAQKSE